MLVIKRPFLYGIVTSNHVAMCSTTLLLTYQNQDDIIVEWMINIKIICVFFVVFFFVVVVVISFREMYIFLKEFTFISFQ